MQPANFPNLHFLSPLETLVGFFGNPGVMTKMRIRDDFAATLELNRLLQANAPPAGADTKCEFGRGAGGLE